MAREYFSSMRSPTQHFAIATIVVADKRERREISINLREIAHPVVIAENYTNNLFFKYKNIYIVFFFNFEEYLNDTCIVMR